MKKILFIAAVCLFGSLTQAVCAEDHSPEQVQQAMVSLLYEIEKAADIDHKASTAIAELGEEGKKILSDSIKNKEEFLSSTYKAYERIDLAKEILEQEAIQVPETLAPSPTTAPYTPNYPPTTSAAYNIVKTLGLTSSNEERCDGLGLEIYEDVLYAAEFAADIGDAVCTVAGCDPIGAVCAIACGLVEAYKEAVLVAKIPIDACNKHSEGVNSAEIEAGYENTVRILDDLATSLGNQDKMLENQEQFLENLDNLLANQQEIIRLLKTPEGHRPGWNETIYTKKK